VVSFKFQIFVYFNIHITYELSLKIISSNLLNNKNRLQRLIKNSDIWLLFLNLDHISEFKLYNLKLHSKFNDLLIHSFIEINFSRNGLKN
jgi:hypothetical protein